MSVYLTSILLASLFAVQSPDDSELKNLQFLNALCKQREKDLEPRCSQYTSGAAVYEDEDLALRTAVLYREQVALLEQRKIRLVLEEPGDSARLRENSLSMARMYLGAALMLLKAYECHAVAEHLDQADKLVLKAREAAGDNGPILEELDKLGVQIAEYIAAIPPPEPPPPPCQKCRPPAPPKAPKPVPPAPPPWAERLALRLDMGFASGRMTRRDSPGYLHGGVTLGLTVLARAALAPRWALLFGPSYTYWRAESFKRGVFSGNSHQVAAHLEVAAAVGLRRKDLVSVHAWAAAGLQHVVFNEASGDSIMAAGSTEKIEYIDKRDRPMTGGTVGGGAGLCFASGSLCAWGRVSSVPGNWDSRTPTWAATVSVDFFAIARASRARKARIHKKKVP
jgi:hypothetical protein